MCYVRFILISATGYSDDKIFHAFVTFPICHICSFVPIICCICQPFVRIFEPVLPMFISMRNTRSLFSHFFASIVSTCQPFILSVATLVFFFFTLSYLPIMLFEFVCLLVAAWMVVSSRFLHLCTVQSFLQFSPAT